MPTSRKYKRPPPKADESSDSTDDSESDEIEPRGSSCCRGRTKQVKGQRKGKQKAKSLDRGQGRGNNNGDSGDDFFDIASGHRDAMRRMDRMFQDPFLTMGGGGMLALPDHHRRGHRRQQQQQAQNLAVADRHMFMDPFAHFQNMFSGMHAMMSDMHRAFDTAPQGPTGQMFQHSSYVSYNNAGAEGKPRVYQASTSMTQGPNGVRETRKTVRDSETGVEKMAVGHHINERGHVIERSRNQRTGEANENQELINLDEEEVVPFNQEYQDKWQSTMRGIDQRRHGARYAPLPPRGHHHHQAAAALPDSRRPRKASYRRE